MEKEKVLIVVGDATELLDTMYPYYRLQEAGFEPAAMPPKTRGGQRSTIHHHQGDL